MKIKTVPPPKTPDINTANGSAAVGLMYNSVIQIINVGGGQLTEEEVREREHREFEPSSDEESPLSALEALNRNQRLVLQGDPGSGKSAFVNYLAVCLAGEVLVDSHCNLKLLTEPLPGEEGEPEDQRQPWDHGALAPVRHILRDFAASDCFPAPGIQGETCHLLEFIEADLKKKGCEVYYKILKARLQSGEALVLFDGLE